MLGATSVRFEQSLITLAETRYSDGDMVAAGSVSGVRAGRVLALTGSPAGVQTTLVMGGRWSFKVGKTVDGLIELARESGDVTIVADEALALGLRDARRVRSSSGGARRGASPVPRRCRSRPARNCNRFAPSPRSPAGR